MTTTGTLPTLIPAGESVSSLLYKPENQANQIDHVEESDEDDLTLDEILGKRSGSVTSTPDTIMIPVSSDPESDVLLNDDVPKKKEDESNSNESGDEDGKISSSFESSCKIVPKENKETIKVASPEDDDQPLNFCKQLADKFKLSETICKEGIGNAEVPETEEKSATVNIQSENSINSVEKSSKDSDSIEIEDENESKIDEESADSENTEGKKSNTDDEGSISFMNVLKTPDKDHAKLIADLKKQLNEEKKLNEQWGDKFEETVEQFKTRECYRPHNTYRTLMESQLLKYEQRAKKLKVDDSNVHRIRKNVQTLSSNHSTMYNKLKEYCQETMELKNNIKALTDSVKRFGTLGEKETVTVGCNTDLLVENNGFRKLSVLHKIPSQASKIRFIDTNSKARRNNISSPQLFPMKSMNQNGNVQHIQSIPTSTGYQFNNTGVVHVVNSNNQHSNQNFVVLNSKQFNQNTQSSPKFHVFNGHLVNSQLPPSTLPVHRPKTNGSLPVKINVSKASAVAAPGPASPVNEVHSANKSPPQQTGQKRPRTPVKSGFVDLTDDEPSGKKLVTSGQTSPTVQNGNIRNSESVQNRNVRQRYRGSSVTSSSAADKLMIDTIIGKIKLPQKPTPPRFCKPVPEDAKSLPGKLKIDANFEGVSNMKLVWSFSDSTDPKLNDRADCASYELYVCTIRKNDLVESKRVWQRIGGKDIPGHRIPVKCSLKNFDRENDYIFLVRGKDSHGRVGEFSEFSLAKK